MRKVIKKSDINQMVKLFNLSEDEQWWLKNISYDINDEQNYYQYTTNLSFIMSPNYFPTREQGVAISAILLYYGVQVQKTIGTFFNETCRELGRILNADPHWMARIFRGMSYSNPRWSDKVYVADRCGLNVLELKLA